MKRRTFLTGVAALSAATSVSLRAAAQDLDTDTEADIRETVLGEIRAWGGRSLSGIGGSPPDIIGPATVEATRSMIARGRDYIVPRMTPELRERLNVRYWDPQAASRPEPQWVDAAAQPDYRHLVRYAAPPETFSLDADVLQFLASRNDFAFRNARPVRLFGLRGCVIEGEGLETDWARSHTVKCATPNHINPRCTLGLWRVGDGQLRLFRASTVPQAANMFVSLLQDGWGTSILPTGFYRYRLGTHNFGTPRPQAGALKNEESYAVLRTTRDLVYDVHSPVDVWTIGGNHNIHAAGMDWANPRYDSSGCQVVHGKYTPDRLYTEGAWSTFRRDAALVGADGLAAADESPGQGTYDYMLLTGLEAALAKHGAPDFTDNYRPLRHGSRGARVAEAQRRLIAKFPRVLGRPMGNADGVFGATTSFAVLSEYKDAEQEYLSTVLA
jgi:hypothetical protein